MALTVRLNPKTERALNALAKRRGLSRSDVVREAIERYDAQERDVRKPPSLQRMAGRDRHRHAGRPGTCAHDRRAVHRDRSPGGPVRAVLVDAGPLVALLDRATRRTRRASAR